MGSFSIKMSPYVREKMHRTGKWYRQDNFCTGGPGGQNQNAKKNGVRLTDLTTLLSAECREERNSQANQARAFRKLVEKMVKFYQREEFDLIVKDKHPQLAIRTYNFKRNEAVDRRTGASYPLDEILNGELDKMLEDLLLMKANLDASDS